MWIEIGAMISGYAPRNVTFREEGVDWNCHYSWCKRCQRRHLPRGRCGLKFEQWFLMNYLSPSARKGWIEIVSKELTARERVSPSVRKVWIEICDVVDNHYRNHVTFRKEGVDWNSARFAVHVGIAKSPSARKVWIEIRACLRCLALLLLRHLPRGRCGLK